MAVSTWPRGFAVSWLMVTARAGFPAHVDRAESRPFDLPQFEAAPAHQITYHRGPRKDLPCSGKSEPPSAAIPRSTRPNWFLNQPGGWAARSRSFFPRAFTILLFRAQLELA